LLTATITKVKERANRLARLQKLTGRASVQGKYGVNCVNHWVEERTGDVFRLVEAPKTESAARVHREAHGGAADEIHEARLTQSQLAF